MLGFVFSLVVSKKNSILEKGREGVGGETVGFPAF
jgi:hypothetical protein